MQALRTALVLSACVQAQFEGPRDMGKILNHEIREASGIAASGVDDSILWTHNDSGDENRIFAISTTGTSLGTFLLPGARARDWEDIASGPGPDPSKRYLYVADIGDNDADTDVKEIYRFEEPAISKTAEDHVGTASKIDILRFRFPDGPRDAEALMVDPRTRDYYVVSKREDKVRVYLAKYPQPLTQVQTLQAVDTLDIQLVVAADISPDGERILMKNYGQVFLWKRGPAQTIAQALAAKPTLLPYQPEPQGEAICWNRAGTGYFTLSEKKKKKPHLYFYGK
ncbi:MAG: hypothetical protein IPK50_11785 [Fibrobacterota bacterium]|nr:hypothetical protein [Fibrobacterota bacterium]QQS07553.1 MAG: hypothetical protein IPK50_11785 [Fibrobacterota bacterium]